MAARIDMKGMLDDLQAQRDELAVKVHLARREARDEWEALEKKLEHLRARAKVVGHEAGEVADDVGAAARQVVDEIRKGYARIRALV